MNKFEKIIKTAHIMLMLTLMITSFSVAKTITQNQHKDNISKNERVPNHLILLLLNHSDFSCQFCLNSFLQLCNTLQNRNLNNSIIWGILDSGNNQGNPAKGKYTQILKKQLRGFVKGNNIKFPFILDSSHIFEKLINDGSTLIILNRTSIGEILNYIFKKEEGK